MTSRPQTFRAAFNKRRLFNTAAESGRTLNFKYIILVENLVQVMLRGVTLSVAIITGELIYVTAEDFWLLFKEESGKRIWVNNAILDLQKSSCKNGFFQMLRVDESD